VFILSEKVKKFTDDPEYIRLCAEAMETSNDPIARINYTHGKGNRQTYLMFLLEQTQFVLSLSSNDHLMAEQRSLDYLYRALMDAVAHMQEGLPDGVYDYILSNIETFSESLIEESTQP